MACSCRFIFYTQQPCYGLFLSFHFLQATTLQNVLTCKFTMSKVHVDFIKRDCKRHYKVGELKVEQDYKLGQVLQSDFYSKMGNNYKVM